MAQQQRVTVSSILGLRPANEGMSNNEYEWWQCYSFIRPLEPTRTDITEARFISCLAGVTREQAIEKWFDPLRDDDIRREKDLKTVKELQELEAKNKRDGKKS